MPSTATTSPKVWLITGCSSGLGLELALKALAAGDKVIATSRNLSSLAPLEKEGASTIRLDQNESLESIKTSISFALGTYGHIDIVVLNAAYVQRGTLEEATPEVTLQQFQANVFGPLNVLRAVLPHFRERRQGIVALVGSMAAYYPLPNTNLYNATKATLHLLAQGLAGEIEGFGIKTICIEPGMFRTKLLDPSTNIKTTVAQSRIGDYAEMNKESDEAFGNFDGRQRGNPVKGAEVMYEVLTGTGVAEGRALPAFLPLGSDAIECLRKDGERRLRIVEEWEGVANTTDFADGE